VAKTAGGLTTAWRGLVRFTRFEQVLAGVCALIPLVMIGFNDWDIRNSISAFYSMLPAWAFYVPLTVAAMLFVVNGVVREKHFYNTILGIALFAIILFDHQGSISKIVHYVAVGIFFAGNALVILRARADWWIKAAILGGAGLLFLVAFLVDGYKLFWLEWASLGVIATHFILETLGRDWYNGPRSRREMHTGSAAAPAAAA
jgi:hypothetical protein